MKKLLVSMMLILGMLAFAAESAPSATVGYVKYSNVTTATTNLNFVALPVDAGYTMVGEFDPTSTNIGTISKWDPSTQSWIGTSYNPMFGWMGNFAAVGGQAYMLNAKSAFDFVVDGPVVANPAYNLITTATTNLNFIMHPLTLASLTTAGAIGTDIGSVGTVSQWVAATQSWQGTSYNPMFGWMGNYASEIGKPLMVNMTADVVWPGSKGELVEGTKAEPKGTPRDIYWDVVDASMAKYDFTGAPYDNVTAKAWITSRPTELQTTTAGNITYMDFGTNSVLYLNVGNFTTAWAGGDELNLVAKDEGITPNWQGEIVPFILDGTANAVFGGLGEPGTVAISVDHESSIDGNMPLETKLEQNYPNPFNPTTTINFSLKSEGIAKLNVYNYTGQLVNSLVNGQMAAGFHTVNFDASNLSAGVYYYTLEADNKTMTNKMVLVK
jgi:hypothetical protein